MIPFGILVQSSKYQQPGAYDAPVVDVCSENFILYLFVSFVWFIASKKSVWYPTLFRNVYDFLCQID